MKKVFAAAILPLMLVISIGSLAGAALYRFEQPPHYPASASDTPARCPVPQSDGTEMAWEAFSRKAVSAILFR